MNVMTLPEIMDKSLDILRKYIKSIITFSLAYGILMIIIMIPVVIVVGIIIGIMAAGGVSPVILIILGVLLGVPLIFGISLSHYVGLIKIASQDILKEKVLATEAITASFKSFFKCIGIGAAGTAASLPLLAVFGGLGYLIYMYSGAYGFLADPFGSMLGNGANAVLLTVLILVLFIALAFILALYLNYFSFSLQALTVEKLGVISSIKRSFTLVKGTFWRIFGCMLLFYATVYIISSSLQSVFALIGGLVYLLLKFLNFSQELLPFVLTVYNYCSYPVSILSALVISPLWIIMMTQLYYNRRFIKDGYDMKLKLDEIRQSSLTDLSDKQQESGQQL